MISSYASRLSKLKSIEFHNLFTRILSIPISLVGPIITMQWFLYDSKSTVSC
jgi:solute carrier family 25 (mitochondrial phosphate transporter), member 3